MYWIYLISRSTVTNTKKELANFITILIIDHK
jgi:hypothetical protein